MNAQPGRDAIETKPAAQSRMSINRHIRIFSVHQMMNGATNSGLLIEDMTRGQPGTAGAMMGEFEITKQIFVVIHGDTTDADALHVTKRITATGAEYRITGPLEEAIQNLVNFNRDRAWQPIETAPKDGTALIAGGTCQWGMYGASPFKGVTIASLGLAEPGATHPWQGNNLGGHDEFMWHAPTHWMPLPTPPKTGDKDE